MAPTENKFQSVIALLRNNLTAVVATKCPHDFRRLGFLILYICWIGSGWHPLAQAQTNVVVALSHTDPVKDLVHAAFDGDSQRISVLLGQGVNPNACIGPGLTALQAAEIKGHSDIVGLLAKTGAETHKATLKPEVVLDWYVKEKLRRGSPGLALAVVCDGKLAFEQGWGLANLEYDIPITPTTVFHAASVSKQFTAFAIARLIQRGKLSLDDDIRKHLPELHDCGARITVRHLLSHTSGLRDQWMLLRLAGKLNGDVVSQKDVMNLLERQQELLFSPGDRFLYCNSGYTLLSEIVADVSGKSFSDFTQKEIFEPLRMTNSHFHANSQEVVKRMAYCYYQSPDGSYRKDLLNYETVGATGLYTTVEDLAKWMANALQPKLEPVAAFALLQQPGRLNSGEETDYGMGLFFETYRGARLIQHGGADASYRSFVLWFPDLRLGVALLSNLGSINSREIALTAADIYLGGRLQPVAAKAPDCEWPSIKLSAPEMDRYVGKYELYWRITEIRRVEDHLEIREDNYPPEVLTANGGHRFTAGNRWFVFQNVESGKALQFTNNWKEHFNRVDAPEEQQPDLSAYAGEFWSSELETWLRIHQRDGRLVLELHRQGEYPLRYVARNIFVSASSRYPWFELKFLRDSKEAVNGLRLNGIRFKRSQLE
ncbi:MAG TPA: serine hydrolase [Clostridia bacterium]|nr:serine hydrolase [Clostridia bacterium]